jgi:hypothetical protein
MAPPLCGSGLRELDDAVCGPRRRGASRPPALTTRSSANPDPVVRTAPTGGAKTHPHQRLTGMEVLQRPAPLQLHRVLDRGGRKLGGVRAQRAHWGRSLTRRYDAPPTPACSRGGGGRITRLAPLRCWRDIRDAGANMTTVDRRRPWLAGTSRSSVGRAN